MVQVEFLDQLHVGRSKHEDIDLHVHSDSVMLRNSSKAGQTHLEKVAEINQHPISLFDSAYDIDASCHHIEDSSPTCEIGVESKRVEA